MDQLPPDSHWATASQVATEAAEAPVAPISGTATAAPVTPARVAIRTTLDGRRCLPLLESSMVLLTDAYEVSCRVRACELPGHPLSRTASPPAGVPSAFRRPGCRHLPGSPAPAYGALRVGPLRPTAGFGVTVEGARGASGSDRRHTQPRHSKMDITANQPLTLRPCGSFSQVMAKMDGPDGQGAPVEAKRPMSHLRISGHRSLNCPRFRGVFPLLISWPQRSPPRRPERPRRRRGSGSGRAG